MLGKRRKVNSNGIKRCALYFFIAGLLLAVHFILDAQEFKYPYSSLKDRDPMRPLVNERGEVLIKEKKELGDSLLQGIIYSQEGSVAIINNEMYKESGIFQGYKIKKIEKNTVILERDGREFTLKWEG
jgi:hypothetical protein